MWVAIVVAVIALLMVAFMPKPNIENARASKLGDFQVPRAKYGDPLPLIWGTVRQKSPITLWFGDFKPVAITKKVPSGAFSSKRVVTGYKNYIGIDCALALGPNVVLKKFWAGTKLAWEGTASGIQDITIDLPDIFGGDERQGGLKGTLTFYDGRSDPPRDAYLANVLSPNVPAYNGLARAVFKSFYIGTTSNLEMFSFEISRITRGLHPTYSVMPNGLDVNPMEICYDVITSKRGCFGNLATVLNIPSFVACAHTLYDEGLGMSLSAQSAITGKDILEEIMRQCDGLLYQDPATSEIFAKLIREDYDAATLPIIDESIVTDLKNFSKTTWANTLNQCRVTFKDRAADYDDSVAIAQDFANINYQQRVKSTEISSPGCMDSTVANKLASRQLSLLSVPLYKCDIVCNRKAQDLRPGSVFKLNWSPFGLANMIMRVSKIDFGELEKGTIKISCVQDRFATASPVFLPPDVSDWTPPTNDAANITDAVLWNAPAYLCYLDAESDPFQFNNAERLYALATAPSNASLAFDVIFSRVASTVNSGDKVLTAAPYNASGTLVNSYGATVAEIERYDTTKVFKVGGLTDAELEQIPNYTTISEIRDGSAMMLVNNELFAFVGYEVTGFQEIAIKGLYRGILDSAPQTHAAGSKVWFIAGRSNIIPPTLNTAAVETAYSKLLDVTALQTYPVELATRRDMTVNGRAGKPNPVNYVRINDNRVPGTIYNNGNVTLSWRFRSRIEFAVYNDPMNTQEAGQKARILWRVGSDAWTASETGTFFFSFEGQLAGRVGRLECRVYALDTTTGRLSDIYEEISCFLENPPG